MRMMFRLGLPKDTQKQRKGDYRSVVRLISNQIKVHSITYKSPLMQLFGGIPPSLVPLF